MSSKLNSALLKLNKDHKPKTSKLITPVNINTVVQQTGIIENKSLIKKLSFRATEEDFKKPDVTVTAGAKRESKISEKNVPLSFAEKLNRLNKKPNNDQPPNTEPSRRVSTTLGTKNQTSIYSPLKDKVSTQQQQTVTTGMSENGVKGVKEMISYLNQANKTTTEPNKRVSVYNQNKLISPSKARTSTVPLTGTSTVPSTVTSTVPLTGTSTVPSTVTSTVPSTVTSTVPLTGTSTTPLTGTSTVPSTVTSTVPLTGTSSVPSTGTVSSMSFKERIAAMQQGNNTIKLQPIQENQGQIPDEGKEKSRIPSSYTQGIRKSKLQSQHTFASKINMMNQPSTNRQSIVSQNTFQGTTSVNPTVSSSVKIMMAKLQPTPMKPSPVDSIVSQMNQTKIEKKKSIYSLTNKLNEIPIKTEEKKIPTKEEKAQIFKNKLASAKLLEIKKKAGMQEKQPSERIMNMANNLQGKLGMGMMGMGQPPAKIVNKENIFQGADVQFIDDDDVPDNIVEEEVKPVEAIILDKPVKKDIARKRIKTVFTD